MGQLLTHRIAERLTAEPQSPVFTIHGDHGELRVTGEEVAAATSVAFDHLKTAAGVRPGDVVVLQLPTSLEFVSYLLGTLFLGGIPVVAPEAELAAGAEGHRARARLIATENRPAALVGVADGPHDLEISCPMLEARPVADLLAGPADLPESRRKAPHDFVLQYTSGSTTKARACVLGDDEIIACCRAIATRLDCVSTTPLVGWAPMYHDMGLIGSILMPLTTVGHVHLLPTLRFALDPLSWLDIMSMSNAEVTSATPTALGMCARALQRRLRRGSEVTLDLSNLRVLAVGAETIRAQTLALFADAVRPFGFDERAFRSTWGLAENVLLASMSSGPPRFVTVEADPLELTGTVISGSADGPATREVASCGEALLGVTIAVDAGGGPTQERGRVGELFIKSSFQMRGYLDGTSLVDDAGWLHTGDLGYLGEAGDVFVVGRSKEVLILGGRNIAPDEVEDAVSECEGIRPGCVIASSVFDPARHTEGVAVLAELYPGADVESAERAVRRAVLAATGHQPILVRFIGPNELPRTTSGKKMRSLWTAQAVAELP